MPCSRKSISKHMRFSVLNRDSFTCQYCGRKAPEVQLHVDHVDPVADGGRTEMPNLVTSCEECNLGKMAMPLWENKSISAILSAIAYYVTVEEHRWDEFRDLVISCLKIGCQLERLRAAAQDYLGRPFDSFLYGLHNDIQFENYEKEMYGEYDEYISEIKRSVEAEEFERKEFERQQKIDADWLAVLAKEEETESWDEDEDDTFFKLWEARQQEILGCK